MGQGANMEGGKDEGRERRGRERRVPAAVYVGEGRWAVGEKDGR